VLALLAAMAIGGVTVASASAPQSKSYIAYTSGGNASSVWIANTDGSDPRRIAAGDGPLISPNGAYVAIQHFASSGVALELYSTAGKLMAGYFNSAKDSATALAWSPNSRYLAVSLSSTSTKGGGALGLIDTSTLKSRVVATGDIAGASFNPAGTQLVFGLSHSVQLSTPTNLYIAGVTGGGTAQLTTNGDSFEPVWARSGIVFDRSTPRGVSKAPIYQLWIDAAGKLRQLTHLRVPALLSGLAPLEASADGNRLIAEYGGEDTSYAWTVQLSPFQVKPLNVAGQPVNAGQVQGAQISSNGKRLLVAVGSFEQPPNKGEVESVGFGGGTPTKLAHGTQPSWSS
jgi:Tol biopolymer transport system component